MINKFSNWMSRIQRLDNLWADKPSGLSYTKQHHLVVKNYLLPMLSIFIVAFVVYSNTLQNDFVYDDKYQILGNRWITDIRFIPDIFTSNVAGFDPRFTTNYYRPFMHIIYICNYFVFGLNPWGYHLVNIILHSCVSVLVFLVSSKLLEKADTESSTFTSFIAAIFFATHPIHTEPVAWVGAVPDLSFTFFYLLSFYLYICSTNDDSFFKMFKIVLSAVSFFIAAICKEPALTLPVVIFLYDYVFLATRKRRIPFIKYVPFILAAVIYFSLRIYALKSIVPSKINHLTFFQNIINALTLFSDYLWKLFSPLNLSALYVFHPVTSIYQVKAILGIIITIVYIYLVIVSFNRNRIIFFSLVSFFLFLLPALYLPGLGESPFSERYLYLPSFSFVLLLAYFTSWAKASISRPIVFLTMIPWILVVMYSVGTIVRNPVWKNDYTVWNNVLSKEPESATAHENFGIALYKLGKINDAISHYRKSLAINPNLVSAHSNLGVAYRANNMLDQSIDEFKKALALNPNYIDALYNLGQIYMMKGWAALSIQEFTHIVKLNPNIDYAHYDLGIAYRYVGMLDKAVEHFDSAVKLNPSNKAYHQDLIKTKDMLYSSIVNQH
jgi:tetratricopeptide (TPR) repeat protein